METVRYLGRFFCHFRSITQNPSKISRPTLLHILSK